MGEVVKNLHGLLGEMLPQVCELLVAQVSFQTLQYKGYNNKENYYKCRDCYDHVTDLCISK